MIEEGFVQLRRQRNILHLSPLLHVPQNTHSLKMPHLFYYSTSNVDLYCWNILPTFWLIFWGKAKILCQTASTTWYSSHHLQNLSDMFWFDCILFKNFCLWPINSINKKAYLVVLTFKCDLIPFEITQCCMSQITDIYSET